MNRLKHICRTVIELIKRAGLIPRAIVEDANNRQRREAVNEMEAERLDRIRHPSKYRCK